MGAARYESNWFVNAAMGHEYAETAFALKAACERAGATEAEMRKVRPPAAAAAAGSLLVDSVGPGGSPVLAAGSEHRR